MSKYRVFLSPADQTGMRGETQLTFITEERVCEGVLGKVQWKFPEENDQNCFMDLGGSWSGKVNKYGFVVLELRWESC